MLHDALKKLNNYPFHMPGHKRNPAFDIIGSEIDITEIKGFDNLHDAHTLIQDCENDLADIYGAKRSFISVGGSTLGVLAAVCAVCDNGDTVIVAQNCHKSVYHACLLKGLRIVTVAPDFDARHGMFRRLEQHSIDATLAQYPQAKAVVITSPTYEGYVSRIHAPIPLIVDAAHGAHFGLARFPAYMQGDIVISSLHKTLPALTQTAVVNVYNPSYCAAMKFWLDVLETSSPSYVLMNSVSRCCELMKHYPQYFETHYRLAEDFQKTKLQHLRLLQTDDISKIIVSAYGTDMSACQLGDTLRESYHIEPEMESARYLVLMTSAGDEAPAYERLKQALREIDAGVQQREALPFPAPPCAQEPFAVVRTADATPVRPAEAVGKTAQEFVYAYPPDIPLLIPGKRITQADTNYLQLLADSGVNILSDSGMFPNNVLTKAQQ